MKIGDKFEIDMGYPRISEVTLLDEKELMVDGRPVLFVCVERDVLQGGGSVWVGKSEFIKGAKNV